MNTARRTAAIPGTEHVGVLYEICTNRFIVALLQKFACLREPDQREFYQDLEVRELGAGWHEIHLDAPLEVYAEFRYSDDAERYLADRWPSAAEGAD